MGSMGKRLLLSDADFQETQSCRRVALKLWVDRIKYRILYTIFILLFTKMIRSALYKDMG